MNSINTTTQRLEKHNAILLRQVDQLRSLFEQFSEEIIDKLHGSQRYVDEKFLNLERVTTENYSKFEKLSKEFVFYKENIDSRFHRIKA